MICGATVVSKFIKMALTEKKTTGKALNKYL